MSFELFVATNLILLVGAMVIAVGRLIRGPSLVDRVLVFDLLSVALMGLGILLTMVSGQVVFADFVFLLAFMYFIGTVGFAYLQERRSA